MGYFCCRPEQPSFHIRPVPGGIKILLQKLNGARMRRNVANLSAFAMHANIFDAFSLRAVFDPKTAKFAPPHRMKQKHGQNCAIPLAF